LSDREDVGRFLRKRSEEAFLVLYRRHTPGLLALASRLTGGKTHDAEDAVQESWLRAVAALPRFEWKSSLRTWLCGFVVNCCHEKRRGRAQPPVEEGITATFDERLDVDRAVVALPEGYRQVLLLHDWYGYTHEEIATMLDIETGTSKSQLHHVRAAVRDSLRHGEKS
jgi:RNA polymerase sigma-70 factor (ECF subfamily)